MRYYTYKNKLYQYVDEALNVETQEIHVIYKPMYDAGVTMFTRNKKDFFRKFDKEAYIIEAENKIKTTAREYIRQIRRMKYRGSDISDFDDKIRRAEKAIKEGRGESTDW